MIQQRLGESDKDYEARKKRVRRTRQGINANDLAHGGGGGASISHSNVCMSNPGISSGWQGYDAGLGIGTVKPDAASDGTLFYAFRWQNPVVDGTIEIKWGATGQTQLTDVQSILVTNNDGTQAFTAEWDKTELCYIAKEPVYVQALIDAFAGGQTEWCFGMYVLPDTFIHYDFSELETGEG